MQTRHIIELEGKNLHASFSKDYQPIITIESGDSVQFQTPDVGWGYNPKDGKRIFFKSRERESEWGHPMIGPISIIGAKPGMTLEIQINELIPAWYGWTCAAGEKNWHNLQLGLAEQEELTVDWRLDQENNRGYCQIHDQLFSIQLSPFLGVMATAPSESGVYSTMPPRYCGGNIDCKELTKGSVLYLPIAVEGGLFSAGDGHATQGDGEVSGQAIECPMDLVDLTLTIREDMNIKMPRANTSAGWITFGFHEDLNEAAIMALDEMIQLIQEVYQVDKREATALASVTVNLRITQIVNGVKGVHAVLPHDGLRKE